MEGSKEVDHRADIFSLGVVFYELLTGELPVGRSDPPSKTVGVDVRLDEVVLRALEREPTWRYQQASEVKTQVQAISDISPLVAQRLFGWEYRSPAEIFGWPLLHVAFGLDAKTGKRRIAKGLIAIGDLAVGGIAIGGVAFGGVACGGVAVGFVSLGGLALSLLLAIGGCAIGPLAFGGLAIGAIAVGGAHWLLRGRRRGDGLLHRYRCGHEPGSRQRIRQTREALARRAAVAGRWCASIFWADVYFQLALFLTGRVSRRATEANDRDRRLSPPVAVRWPDADWPGDCHARAVAADRSWSGSLRDQTTRIASVPMELALPSADHAVRLFAAGRNCRCSGGVSRRRRFGWVSPPLRSRCA